MTSKLFDKTEGIGVKGVYVTIIIDRGTKQCSRFTFFREPCLVHESVKTKK